MVRDEDGEPIYRVVKESCFSAWLSESRRVAVSRSPAEARSLPLEQEPA